MMFESSKPFYIENETTMPLSPATEARRRLLDGIAQMEANRLISHKTANIARDDVYKMDETIGEVCRERNRALEERDRLKAQHQVDQAAIKNRSDERDRIATEAFNYRSRMEDEVSKVHVALNNAGVASVNGNLTLLQRVNSLIEDRTTVMKERDAALAGPWRPDLKKERDDLKAKLDAMNQILNEIDTLAENAGADKRGGTLQKVQWLVNEVEKESLQLTWADHNRVVENLQRERDTYKRSREASQAALAEKISELQDVRNKIEKLQKHNASWEISCNSLRQERNQLQTALSARQENADILEALVRAKDLKDRGKTAEYEKAKEGLWERAFAYCNMPVPKELFCPKCGHLHVDKNEDDAGGGEDWTKKLHKTHLCHNCKHMWRPFEYPTVGVSIEGTQQEVKNPLDQLNPNRLAGAFGPPPPGRLPSVREKLAKIRNEVCHPGLPNWHHNVLLVNLAELICESMSNGGIDMKPIKES